MNLKMLLPVLLGILAGAAASSLPGLIRPITKKAGTKNLLIADSWTTHEVVLRVQENRANVEAAFAEVQGQGLLAPGYDLPTM